MSAYTTEGWSDFMVAAAGASAALVGWLDVVIIQARTGEDAAVKAHRRSAVLLTQIAILPCIVAGVSLMAEAGGGLYWLQAGVILSLLVALSNGWVLLVEILR